MLVFDKKSSSNCLNLIILEKCSRLHYEQEESQEEDQL